MKVASKIQFPKKINDHNNAADTVGTIQRKGPKETKNGLLSHVLVKDCSNPLEHFDAIQFKRRFHIFEDTFIFICELIKDNICYPSK